MEWAMKVALLLGERALARAILCLRASGLFVLHHDGFSLFKDLDAKVWPPPFYSWTVRLFLVSRHWTTLGVVPFSRSDGPSSLQGLSNVQGPLHNTLMSLSK